MFPGTAAVRMRAGRGKQPRAWTDRDRETGEREKEMSEMKKDSRIQELFDEVELYRQAIRDAQDALDSAETELDEELDAEYNKA